MTIEQLKHFLVVARFLNISKAAEYLYLGHSTLSRHIASLEEDLGVKLLIRDNRSVQLTDAGKLMKENGPALLEAIKMFENEVKKAGSGLHGTLTIASLNFYCQPLFNEYKKFRSSFPDINFLVNYYNYGTICENVLREKADIGITYSFEAPEGLSQLEILKLFEERFCVVVHNEHPLALRERVCPRI